jgi:hypothetical protein
VEKKQVKCVLLSTEKRQLKAFWLFVVFFCWI